MVKGTKNQCLLVFYNHGIPTVLHKCLFTVLNQVHNSMF